MNMKTTSIIFLFLFYFSFLNFSFGQQNFLPGQIKLAASSEVQEGFIDYQNWDKSPDEIGFKTSLESDKKKYKPEDLEWFKVSDEHYVSANVETENSSTKVRQLEESAELNIEKKQVFLQTLVGGEKGLYFYKNKMDVENFFFKNGDNFELLVYKKYFKRVNGEKGIAYNTKYIGQLNYHFQGCSNIQAKLDNTKYEKRSLIKVFQYYYECTGNTVEFSRASEELKTEFGILAGLSVTDLNFIPKRAVVDASIYRNDYEKSLDASGGLFFNLTFPRKLNKLSFNSELIYSAFNIENVYTDFTSETNYSNHYTTFNYSYIKLNTLFRYKYLLNENSSVFVDFGISNGIALTNDRNYKEERVIANSTFEFEKEIIPLERTYEQGFVGSLGFKYQKFLFLIRHERGTGISSADDLSDYTSRFYFLAGYQF